MRLLGTVVLSLLLASTAGSSAQAQQTVSADALKSAQSVAGTAKIMSARTAGDSLVIEVEDPPFSLRAFEDGEWNFGGRDGYAKEIGREVATVTLAGLSPSTPVTMVVVRVHGANRDSTQLFYRVAELRQRIPST